MSELKPCPFCGDSDVRIGGTNTHAYAYCQGCSAEGPYNDFTADQAIESWNRRTHPQPVTPAGGEVPVAWVVIDRQVGNVVNVLTPDCNEHAQRIAAQDPEYFAAQAYLHPPVADAALVRDAERYRRLRRHTVCVELSHDEPNDEHDDYLDNMADSLPEDAALNQRGGGDHG